jgi:hypothetical protein
MMPLKFPVCTIEKQMRDNYIELFEGLRDAVEAGAFLEWYEENRFLIGQSITELQTVDIEYV